MKILIPFAAAFFASGHLPLRADDAKSLIGVWKGGMPGEPHGSIELTITPTKITGRNSRNGKSLGEGAYELDTVKKTIDAQRTGQGGGRTKYWGVYSLEGKTLKWVSTSRGKKRPADLVHRPERDQYLMILERQP